MKEQREIRRKLTQIEEHDPGIWPDEWRVQQRKGWIDALNWVLKTESAEKAAVHLAEFEEAETEVEA
jgi:hypothetical protein